VLLGLLVHGYATGVFGSRELEQVTHEVAPLRFRRVGCLKEVRGFRQFS